MNSKRYSKDDWDAAMDKGEEASQGMFFKLKKDGDKAYVAFPQPAVTVERPGFRDKNVMVTKMIGNLAIFSEGGGHFVKLQLAEMAPSHWVTWMQMVSDEELGGYDKIYRIKRFGVEGDKDVKYHCNAVRDQTEEEIKMLNELDLIEIHADSADSEADWLDDFRRTCATEWERLGWDKGQGRASIATFFDKFIAAADMTGEQRMNYLSALKQLKKGDGPEQCTGLPATIDLDAEEAF